MVKNAFRMSKNSRVASFVSIRSRGRPSNYFRNKNRLNWIALNAGPDSVAYIGRDFSGCAKLWVLCSALAQLWAVGMNS